MNDLEVQHVSPVSFQPLAFNPRLFLFTSHFYVHLPGHFSSRSPAFCVTSMLLHTSVWKGHASRDLMILSFPGKRAHTYLYVPLLVHGGGCSAIQAGHYYLGFFALLPKSYMLLINIAAKCQVKGQAAGARHSRERALWSLSCFTPHTVIKQASIYHLFAIYTTTRASICYRVSTSLLQCNLREGRAESPGGIWLSPC